MSKQIDYDVEALKKIQQGVNQLANVVKSTMGPGGTNVILEKQSYHHISKDGFSVAREISLPDPVENIGAHILKEASDKTVQGAGDGTTGSIVLAQAIFNAGFKNIVAGAGRMDLKRGIDLAIKTVIPEIKRIATPVADGDLLKVAVISANGDDIIGSLINEAITKVGRDGIISVEDTKNLDSHVTVVEGTRFERGWLSGYFAADNLKQEWSYTDCQVMLYDGAITSYKEIHPLFDKFRKTTQKPLLIVAKDVSGEALAAIAMNYIKGNMIACAVQSMDMNDTRIEHMKDLAALTGATIISKESGISLNTATVSVLGSAGQIRVGQHTTTILQGGGGDKIAARIATIESEIQEAPTEMAKVALQYRKARMSNGIAVVHVGGNTDVEVREKKDRIDDALQATRAALDEGVVIGGGVAYINILTNIKWPKGENADQDLGIKIVASAMEEPFKAIIENVGEKPDVVLAKVRTGSANYGFNAKTLQYCDLIEQGIIDPAKVIRLALENAGSAAGMLLTTRAVVSNIKPK